MNSPTFSIYFLFSLGTSWSNFTIILSQSCLRAGTDGQNRVWHTVGAQKTFITMRQSTRAPGTHVFSLSL